MTDICSTYRAQSTSTDMAKQQRELLKERYPSKKWAAQVDKMSDAQVIAVYMRPQNTKKK